MTRKLKIVLSGVSCLAAFVGAGWLLGALLRLQGRDLWILRGGIGLLGCTSGRGAGDLLDPATLRGPPKPVRERGREGHRCRLQRGPLAARRVGVSTRRVQGLPVVLVLGSGASGKTANWSCAPGWTPNCWPARSTRARPCCHQAAEPVVFAQGGVSRGQRTGHLRRRPLAAPDGPVAARTAACRPRRWLACSAGRAGVPEPESFSDPIGASQFRRLRGRCGLASLS